jgi:pimeloyl-ACP methyl ester carboxylesterase
MNEYQRPMQPYPGLEGFAQYFKLPDNGINLFYYGAGATHLPAALLIHGLGDEADTWRHLIEPLSSNWRVIAPDLPGFGRSDQPERAYTLDFLQDCLSELLEPISGEKFLLVGHSLGGMLAQAICLERPEQVSGLVLIDGGLLVQTQRINPRLLLNLVPGLGEWLYTNLRKDPQAAYASLRPYYSDLNKLPQDERDFLFTRVNQRVWSDDQRRAYFSTLRNTVAAVPRLQKDLAGRLAQVQVPTLVLWGEKDQINAPENGSALVQAQPNARLVVIHQAGHMPHQERADLVVQAILSAFQ